jgi:glycosyltransferase involved in cell wall biosynthesis
MGNEPKVSILMMSYNQGSFIKEAIESVLRQFLPFDWELIIGDDASIDNTSTVVADYVEKYPSHIKYYRYEKNVGLHSNYIFLINKCKGKYIALLEADDYWVDREKIKKQLDFMEQNPDVSWTFTNGNLVNELGEDIQSVTYDLPNIFDLDFYLQNFFNPLNNTIVFKKSADPQIYPEFFKNITQWDTVLHYFRSLDGKIGYLPIDGLAWRRHPNATSFSTSFSSVKRYKDWLIINKNMVQFLPEKLHKYFRVNFIAYEFISLSYFKQKKYLKFAYYLLMMLTCKPIIRKRGYYKNYFWKLRNEN